MLVVTQPDLDTVREMTASLFDGTVTTRVIQHDDEPSYLVFIVTVAASRNPKELAAMHSEWHDRLESIAPESYGSLRLRVAFDDHPE